MQDPTTEELQDPGGNGVSVGAEEEAGLLEAEGSAEGGVFSIARFGGFVWFCYSKRRGLYLSSFFPFFCIVYKIEI